MEQVKILVVEDDVIIAEDISLILKNAGYSITNIIDRGEEVLAEISKNRPDLILLDVTLADRKTGIEVAEEIQLKCPVPFIFLTSLTDKTTVERAKHTRPSAYISKPFDERDLEIAIDLAIFNSSNQNVGTPQSEPVKVSVEEQFVLKDTIFIKKDSHFEKIDIKKINYVEANGHYLVFYLIDKQVMATMTLKSFCEKMQNQHFLQLHRSYAVNLENITGFDDEDVFFDKKRVPIGKTYRKEFLEKFKFL
jgi:DNA-binding LytR/AlgR family response regulator